MDEDEQEEEEEELLLTKVLRGMMMTKRPPLWKLDPKESYSDWTIEIQLGGVPQKRQRQRQPTTTSRRCRYVSCSSKHAGLWNMPK